MPFIVYVLSAVYIYICVCVYLSIYPSIYLSIYPLKEKYLQTEREREKQADGQTNRQIYRQVNVELAHCCRLGISDKFFVLASDAVQMVVMEIVSLAKGWDLTKKLDVGWPETAEQHVTLVLLYRECKEYIKDRL